MGRIPLSLPISPANGLVGVGGIVEAGTDVVVAGVVSGEVVAVVDVEGTDEDCWVTVVDGVDTSDA